MQDRRFFSSFSPGDREIEISGDEWFHVTRVLRGREGEEIEVVNGQGGWCRCRIEKISSHFLRARIEEMEHVERPPLQTVVASSLTRAANTAWMMEKLAEIGVDQVRPVICERSEIGPRRGEVYPLDKWRKLAVSALKVNRRLWLTEFFSPMKLEQLLEDSFFCSSKLFLDIAGKMEGVKKQKAPILALIGPPGDFTPREKERIRDRGFVAVKINDAILKTETAAISIAAILKND